MLPCLSAALTMASSPLNWRRDRGGNQEVPRDRAHVEAGPDLYALDAAQGAAVSDAQALRLRSGEATCLAVKWVELIIYYGQIGLRSQQAVRPKKECHEAYNLRKSF